ncbi:MAG: hypothetical protein ACK51N_05565 [bacterium]|nr:hypothetical protein [Phycisphaerales bacterium]MCE2652810.1 hypothetical protein [Planctomycetaceae bacterium]
MTDVASVPPPDSVRPPESSAGPAPSRRGALLAALLALNAALVGAVALAAMTTTAQATGTGLNRPRGQYTLVGGRVSGSPANGMYVVDSVNREMVVLRWSNSAGRLEGIAFRDLNADASPAGGGAR